MPNRVVYWNGDFIPETEARVSIFDNSLMFGDMVFEMTRSFAQKPFRLREHLERLYASLDYVEIDSGLTIDEMEAATLEAVERNKPELEGLDFQIIARCDTRIGRALRYARQGRNGSDRVDQHASPGEAYGRTGCHVRIGRALCRDATTDGPSALHRSKGEEPESVALTRWPTSTRRGWKRARLPS